MAPEPTLPASEVAARVAGLSPDKRALLEERLMAGRAKRPSSPAITPRPAGGPAPLSFAQGRLWFLDQLAPGSSAYNIPETLRLRGRLDVAALEGALRDFVERHEALRTAFLAEGGDPFGRVEKVLFSLPVTDLRNLPFETREEEARRLAAEESGLPFDLSQPPLIRARLLRLAPEEHWLLLTIHHIVFDDWSMSLLFEQLAEGYAARLSGSRVPGRAPALQYADFAEWQRNWLRGGVLEAQSAYWKDKLGGELPVLTLPTDRARPPIQTFRGAEVRRNVAPMFAEALDRLARQEGATLFMTVLAAFQVLLSRYSGQDDILVGTPVASRSRVETEDLVGFFVNTLVLRGDLSGNPSFREFLRRVRETALEAFAHQDLPFESLIEMLRPERSLSHSPLFQVMFELDSDPVEPPRLHGLSVESVDLPDMSSKFDLRLLVLKKDGGLELVFEYGTDLFDEETIRRMAGHFETLLEGIVRDAHCPVSRLPLLTKEETRRILVEWNDTSASFPRDRCLHELFEEQVDRDPNADAVAFDGRTMTFGELDRRANQVAARLREMEVRGESLVGLCVPRSPEMVVGLLGILKAGGAYVPIDPTHPVDRIAFLLEDTGADVLVTTASVSESLPPFAGRTLRLDEEWGEISRQPLERQPAGVTADGLAYVIYTSGSTGRPKGVMIPHRGVVNYLTWAADAYRVKEGTGAPVQSSLTFDLTVTSLFVPLISGRCVRLLPEGFGIDALGTVLKAGSGFSLVKITPARLDLLVQQMSPEQAPGATHAFVIGGEALRAESLAFWRDFAPETVLYNEYGPTETVVGCCMYRVMPQDSRSGMVPIGRPIANTRLYVLDRHFQPVPVGVTGELFVGGDGVGRGYWKLPERTAERFLPDPFDAASGGRLYRTGDLARYRSDGVLEYLGRTDDQVKIRGFRVELGEIESVIRESPLVSQTAVVLREEAPGDRRLVAYVVANTTAKWSAEALRSFLRDRLPEFMVPSAFVLLPSLPVTGNGKVDRAALPSPDRDRRELEHGYEPPGDALEARIVGIWESVLGTRPVGVEDDFFDLGGHSLLAVRLFAEIETATGRKLPLSALFQSPTIRQLAAAVREVGWSSPWSSLVPIQAGGTRPPFYCVHAVGGSVLPYRELSKRLGRDQPFYGLQAQALDDGTLLLRSVEEMADHYVAEIRSLQPNGPYYLGGHSAGGIVAFEMARRLRAAGEAVPLLALFDTWAPGHGELIAKEYVKERVRKYRERLARFTRAISGGGAIAYLREKIRIRMLVLLGRTSELPPDLQRLQDSIEQAVEEHHVEPYAGSVTLFRAGIQPSDYAIDRALGWSPLARGGVEVHEVPGHHGDIVDVEPQASLLAEQLRECLDRAIAQDRGDPAHS